MENKKVYECEHRSEKGNCFFPSKPRIGRLGKKKVVCLYHHNSPLKVCSKVTTTKKYPEVK